MNIINSDGDLTGSTSYVNLPESDPTSVPTGISVAGIGVDFSNNIPYSNSTDSLLPVATEAANTITDFNLSDLFNNVVNDLGLDNLLNTVNDVVYFTAGSDNDPFSNFNLFDNISTLSNTFFTDQLNSVDTSGIDFIQSQDLPNINTVNQLVSQNPTGYIANTDISSNPNPSANSTNSEAYPDPKHDQPIANEPQDEFAGQYPYNKSIMSEAGHILEIDDTPGSERLLAQHISGTYQEINPEGRLVTKVVSDKYTIVADNDYVTIQGACTVRILGDATVRIGGHLNLVADAGISLSSKGDFRVKARSVNMESYGGDTNIKSAGNINASADQDFNVTSDAIQMDSTNHTILTSGGEGRLSSSQLNLVSGTAMGIQASEVNIKTAGSTNITSSSVEVDGDMNVKNQVNMGIDAKSATVPKLSNPKPTKAKSSGIAYSTNPGRLLEDNDDDPAAAAAAIKYGLENNLISADELNQTPNPTSSDDSKPSSDPSIDLQHSTIGNLGTSSPPENLKLSKSFTVAMLSSGAAASHHVIHAQQGLSVTDIVGNLQLVATNCLEKIKKQYPDMFVTCGFRPSGVKVKGGAKGVSQHELGMACDIQFSSANRNPGLYYDIAKWIKENVPFDQLILEYKSYDSKLPWIHISFNGKGNRPWSASNKCITMNNGSTVKSGLAQLR